MGTVAEVGSVKWKVQAALGIGALAVALPVAVLFGSGVQAVGEERTGTLSVAPQGAERARVVLEMGEGDLRIARGATGVLDGTFRTNVEGGEPEVDYRVISREGVLRIEQGDGDGFRLPWDTSDAEHNWDLHLTGRLPLALDVELGAGRSSLDLGGLDLLALNVETGAGETQIDLSGPRFRNLTGTVEGGAGEIEVILPRGVGARVTVEQGAGDIEATGFRRDGDTYMNSAYGVSKVTIDLTIKSGAGKVILTSQPDPVRSTPTPPA